MLSKVEQIGWEIERQFLSVHLRTIRLTPEQAGGGEAWQLRPRFTGFVTVCGVLPIPFIGLALPAFMVPIAHADVDKLLTKQPLVSAEVVHSKLPTAGAAAALCDLISDFEFHATAAALVPDVSLQIQTPDEGVTNIDATLLSGGGSGGGANGVDSPDEIYGDVSGAPNRTSGRNPPGKSGGARARPLVMMGLKASGQVSKSEISVKVSEATLRSGNTANMGTSTRSGQAEGGAGTDGANDTSSANGEDREFFVGGKERAGSSGSGFDDDDNTRISVCAFGEFTLALPVIKQLEQQGGRDEDDDRSPLVSPLGSPLSPMVYPSNGKDMPSLVNVLMDAGESSPQI